MVNYLPPIPIPKGHRIRDDLYHGFHIKCLECEQRFFFAGYLDPDKEGESNKIFLDNNVSLPVENSWVVLGWESISTEIHPTIPVDCKEKQDVGLMQKALK